MRDIVYKRLENISIESKGYIQTIELLEKGFTNRQIAQLVKENCLEKVAFGIYWITQSSLKKPKDYKAIEVGLVDSDSVICADSACFYHGIIKKEPEILSVATRRSDRHKIQMDYSINRFYISDSIFDEGIEKIETPFGSYYIYSIERSIVDCYKYKKRISSESYQLINKYVHNGRKTNLERIEKYAEILRVCMSNKSSS
ncbi:MAG: type IV toxin-antitoxin system AbiEi family antitoxin domain-containing protein [Eubacterium sp.]|nr:type IV toxin-antitoxin system AbiEi family antitoxin domain-containing protein [Eubacterium sp.]